MTTKPYHIALVRRESFPYGYGPKCKSDTVLIYMVRELDELPAYVWKHLGQRTITKSTYRARASELLVWINAEYGASFKRVVIR